MVAPGGPGKEACFFPKTESPSARPATHAIPPRLRVPTPSRQKAVWETKLVQARRASVIGLLVHVQAM